MPTWLGSAVYSIVMSLLVIVFIALNAFLLIWLERKVAARIQRRVGPDVVGGPWGILQSLADGIKLFAKEDVRPAAVDRWVWAFAPSVIFMGATLVFLIIPWGPGAVIHNFDAGIVYFAAVSAFSVLGVFMAGWGSNNKYSLLGAMRSVAQMISYEIALVLSMVGVVLISGTLNLNKIVESQANVWFIVPQFVAFIIFIIAALAEMNRVPFDLAHGEQEIVAGYLTEYSGMRWAMFMFAEYTALFTTSAIAATLFLGGWQGPILPGWVWFLIKSYTLVLVFMWIRWTLPRVRIDQLMDLGWKFLVPVALLNVIVTGFIIAVVR